MLQCVSILLNSVLMQLIRSVLDDYYCNLKDNGTKNFYWPDLSGSPMEYLISYFYLSTAYSCEEISK